ncbi:MAG: DUF2283 domain-containing protein [Candidatus Aminicenantes bacterium]|nr:DUF2283 domain-containing protein [Candidatus Aminicenantes bacterium]
MRVTYDKQANAAYIYLASQIFPRSIIDTYTCNPVEVGGEINLDFDNQGRLVGIEILNADKKLPMEVLENAEKNKE